MPNLSTLDRPVHVWMVGVALIALWTGCILASLFWDLRQGRLAMEEAARTAARTAYEKDLAYRRWNATRGPVYVPVSDLVPPNPYLSHDWREITLPEGQVLTLVNPAYMTRQVHEMELEGSGVRSRITSLHPIRPENSPDPWERAALAFLAGGREEVTEVTPIDGREYLRLMRPLFTENSCLGCHPQSNHLGDVRGGLSIAIPMELFAGLAGKHQTDSFLQHGLICVLGLAGIGLGSRRLQKQIDRLRDGKMALQRSEERFRSIFTHAGAGMATVDENGRFIHVNAALCELLGYPEERLLALTVGRITHPKDLPLTARMFEEVRSGQRQRYRYEKRYLREDGSTIWMDVSTAWFQYGDGPTHGVALFQDISDRMRAAFLAKENEERLQYLADHDPLTHLPNRRLLQLRLEHALAKARRDNEQVAILFLDLDRFKTINDSLGHEIGDRLICAIAVRLRAILRETDTLARFGGDEFIVLLEQIGDPADAGRVAQKILKELEQPVVLGEHCLHVSASVGIGLFPGDGQDSHTLIQCADLAMYWAKEKGRNNSQFCTPELNHRTRERLLLESALRQSLEKGELVLYYQPQVNLRSGSLVGLEALLRWQHPVRGLVPPADFIPLAEETGMIKRMGEWVLRTACQQAQDWIGQGFPPFRMAVNISARQFREGNLAVMVDHILQETGFDPTLLELELTESMVMTEVEGAIRIMEDLTRLGVRLAIDDFGAGYSSLSYLRRFPISALKIDRSFVQNVTESARTAALTDSVIHLARRMDLEVVAEGIETEEQKELLVRQHCPTGQGYLFGHPLPARDIRALLATGARDWSRVRALPRPAMR